MSGKRIAAIMVAGVIAVALMGAPAEAGVGGCYRLPYCGGFQAVKAPVVQPVVDETPLLDAMRWLLPSDAFAALKTYVKRGDAAGGGKARTEGVGGCFFLCKF